MASSFESSASIHNAGIASDALFLKRKDAELKKFPLAN